MTEGSGASEQGAANAGAAGDADERGSQAARAAAERERQRLARTDASLEQWQYAEAGAPVLVHTMAGAPSYWLVPIELREGDTAPAGSTRSAGGAAGEADPTSPRLAGFVRASLDGRVTAAGRHHGNVEVVTGITAGEARRRVAADVSPDSVISEPLFVHDGPPGREGWRVDVTGAEGSVRTLLVTRGGITPPKSG